MNKTKMKINRKKSKTRNTTAKIKGGGFFNSITSIFSSKKVSENFGRLLKTKNISDNVQKVYDAKNKDEPTFNKALTDLKEKLKELNLLIPNIESEQKNEYNNKSIKNSLHSNSTNLNARPTNRMNPRTNRGMGTANAVAAGAGAVAGIAGAGAALVEAKNGIFGSK